MKENFVSCSGGERFAEPLAAGSEAPDFDIGAGHGKSGRLSDLRGRPVVLVFSPPGWDPTRVEQQAQYDRVLAKAPYLRAAIVGVGAEPDANAPALLGGIDPSGEIARAYGVSGHSALFVVDERGNICWSYAAPMGAAASADALLAGLDSAAAKRPPAGQIGLTRRQFVAAAIGAAFVLSLPSPARSDDPTPRAANPVAARFEPAAAPVTLMINGRPHTVFIDPRVTLLDALRERIGLTGSKKGCDHGQCGACTVHVDGKRVNSCLMLAVATQGRNIVTIEGLAPGAELTPIQTAFIEHDAFQCGYCTPGQIMSATALLSEDVGPSDDDVRVAMSGNLCRCGAYPNIVDAVQSVRKEARSGSV